MSQNKTPESGKTEDKNVGSKVSAETAKNSWVWTMVSIAISSVVATVLVLTFFDSKMENKIVEHKNNSHPRRVAITGVETVVEEDRLIGKAEIQCYCPRDKIAIGGGGEVTDAGNNIVIVKNSPIIRDNQSIGWEINGVNSFPNDHSIYTYKVYAICAPVETAE